MTSHGEFRVILNSFPFSLIGRLTFIFFSKVCGGDATCWLHQNDTTVHAAIPGQVSLETRRRRHTPFDGSAAAGLQPAPVPAGRQVLLKYTVWGAEMCPILSAAADRRSRGAGGRHG